MNATGRKKVLHISELSQIAIRYNWRYLRSKSAIVYDGGNLKIEDSMIKLTPTHCVSKPFNNEYQRNKKVLHISALSQIAIRHNWHDLRPKLTIAYYEEKLKMGEFLWSN